MGHFGVLNGTFWGARWDILGCWPDRALNGTDWGVEHEFFYVLSKQDRLGCQTGQIRVYGKNGSTQAFQAAWAGPALQVANGEKYGWAGPGPFILRGSDGSGYIFPVAGSFWFGCR